MLNVALRTLGHLDAGSELAEPYKPVRACRRVGNLHGVEGSPLVHGGALVPGYRGLGAAAKVGLEIVPLIVGAALEADNSGLSLVEHGVNQHVAFLVAVENELDVGGEGGVLPAGPVHAGVLVQTLCNALQAKQRSKRKHLVIVTVAQVCAVFTGGDGCIGLFNDVIDKGLGARHPDVAEFHGIALSKVEVHGDALGIPVQFVGGEQAEQAVVKSEGGTSSCHIVGAHHKGDYVSHHFLCPGGIGEHLCAERISVRLVVGIKPACDFADFRAHFTGVVAADVLLKCLACIPADIQIGLHT